MMNEKTVCNIIHRLSLNGLLMKVLMFCHLELDKICRRGKEETLSSMAYPCPKEITVRNI